MRPNVFVFYIMESEQYVKKVQRFIRNLRLYGISILTLDDMKYGERVTTFIERIEKCDYIFLACTPEYKRRSERGKNGVVYECDSIAQYIANISNKRNIIPVLLSGDWSTSLPAWLEGVCGIDYREESEDEIMYFINAINRYIEICENKQLQKGILQKTFSVEHADGTIDTHNIVTCFQMKDTGEEYVVYSDDEEDRDGNSIIYVLKIIQKDGDELLAQIEDEEEWRRVKDILLELGQDDDSDE